MTILQLSRALGKLTRQDMKSRVEAMLRDIQDTTTSLLQDIGVADPREAEAIREEVSRLNGIGFTLTRLLSFDDIETAYRLVNGDPDQDGEVLGVAI